MDSVSCYFYQQLCHGYDKVANWIMIIQLDTTNFPKMSYAIVRPSHNNMIIPACMLCVCAFVMLSSHWFPYSLMYIPKLGEWQMLVQEAFLHSSELQFRFRTPTCLKLNFSYYEGEGISDFPAIKGPTSGGSNEGPTVIIMQLDIFTYKKEEDYSCAHLFSLVVVVG